MRFWVLCLAFASAATAQPVATGHLLNVTDAVGVRLEGASDSWKAPPVLYWSGVALDAAALAGGAYVVVLGAQLLDHSNDDAAGPGAVVGAMFGALFLGVGGLVAGASAYDLIRVLGGDDPALARVFDPTRVYPGMPPPRYPPPDL